MRYNFFIRIFFIAILFSGGFANGQEQQSKKDTTSFFGRAGKKITAKRNWLLGIMLNRTPETGFLTGLHYVQFFKMSRDTNLRTSNLDFTFSYTEKRQVIFMLNNMLVFKKEKYMLRGTNAYKKFNEYFWGIGNKAPESNKELVNFDVRQVTQRFSRAVTSKIFAGIQYQYYMISDVVPIKGGLLDTLNIVGSKGSLTSGAGLDFLYDSRDNIINSYKGFYLDISNFVNDKKLGSKYSFNNITVDARRYIQIFPRNILALQGIANFNWGEVPFRQMANMGGEKMMRGYYYGRYRDKNMLAFQAEYRFPVWKFIGLAVFGSCGEVADKVNEFDTKTVLFGYGIGLRLLWIAHERVNVVFDVGFGKKSAGSYGGTGEVF